MADDRFLVVGLGNPGTRYAATRHNLGFRVVGLLADRMAGRFKSLRTPGAQVEVVEGRLVQLPAVLARPLSYMNDSGGPVSAVAKFYKVPPERIVIVHDELDLPFGSLRLKQGGGDGGHNGLKSITASLGTPDYHRVRIGIGRPPGRQDAADYVLREFSSAERKELPYEIDRAADAVEAIMVGGLPAAQNQFND
ncbi:MAG: aminoacyl-tRNA hydrolase [Jatrophihabitans sp.]